ncbi:MAG: hypothetical protein DI603_08510 [Roseateles depolymerans]|uniref:Diguanylate cyclase n=1 Tax=Roseateles depolymerans TaxID=76731 RepID=A0A2W5FQX9_9BURK|nr:MAG: hypothetical protein DI603_08510 [Roseateles depolymerans]
MTSLLLSSSFIALLGGAMLGLARLEPTHRHIWYWGWCQITLAGTLILGVALMPADQTSMRFQVQAALATFCMIATLACELAGAAHYTRRTWNWRLYLPAFVALFALVIGMAVWRQPVAIWIASVALAGGDWLAGRWIWRAGSAAERWAALCFVVSGLLHFISPLEDPLARAEFAHIAGTFMQSVLAMSLILLSVRRAQREASAMSERLRQLYEQAMQGLMIVRDGQVLYANPAALAMFGYDSLAELGPGAPLQRVVPPEHRAGVVERYAQIMAQRLERIEWEGERLHRDGRRLYLRGSAGYIEWEDGPAQLLLMLDDTERQRALNALRRQALHDELTDLPNRHAALARLAELTLPGSAGFALLSADLDRFQLVNESLGHEVGDALLQAIAARLKAALPAAAMLSRLGEDQFLLLLPGVEDATAASLAGERVLATMIAPFAIQHRRLYVHLSVGVARYPADGDTGAALLRAADIAMHRAKQQAGAAVVAFEPGMTVRSGERLEIEQALAAAIEAEEFVLVYQPKFRAGSRTLAGFEALVRWQRPGRGPVSPAEFIPAAERTGQIAALGTLILRLAARQLRAWGTRHGAVPPLAINVSPLQFADPCFAQALMAMMQAHGVPLDRVEVEVTETAAVTHLDRVLPQLARLREAGVGVAFDDFGTGQSSLTLLRRLPITTLKLDRSMIDPLPEPTADAIVQAACLLAQALGLDVVAEGVETEAQARAAERLGCTHLQGYLLGRPLDAEAAGALLAPAPATQVAGAAGTA